MKKTTELSNENNGLRLGLVLKSCRTTEIVEKRMNGKHVVKYRAPYGSDAAKNMMNEVDKLKGDTYYYRHV